MTIKVTMNDGRIEEYPNAYITWEWDDSNEEGFGTNSGFRIGAMDKNCNTASAFVYPSECKKIEITSEECDRVFAAPPSEEVISGKRFRKFVEIDKECKRQERTWGERNLPLISESLVTGKEGITEFPREDVLENQRRHCALRSTTDKYSWFDILLERMCEAFLEDESDKQREGMIKVASVAVQIIEYLDRRIGQ